MPRFLLSSFQGLFFAVLSLSATAAYSQGVRVGFRADHTVIARGRPFFPVGLYYCGEEFDDASGKLLKELADYGFNTLGYYPSGNAWKAELDQAHRLGPK